MTACKLTGWLLATINDMKKLLTILTMLCFALQSFGATVTVNVHDFTGVPANNRRVTVTLVQPGPVALGNWVFTGDSVAKFTGTDGIATFTNLLTLGSYRFDIAGAPSRSYLFCVSSTNGTYNVVNLLGDCTTNSVVAYYTADQIDAMTNFNTAGLNGKVAKAGDIMSGPLTNNVGYYGNGGPLTNLNGTNIVAGTINSNKFDQETLTLIAQGGSGGTIAAVRTNGVNVGTSVATLNLVPTTSLTLTGGVVGSTVTIGIPTASAGGGTGIQTNGGTGGNNIFTNASLLGTVSFFSDLQFADFGGNAQFQYPLTGDSAVTFDQTTETMVIDNKFRVDGTSLFSSPMTNNAGIYGNAVGLTNASPNIATNGATASDGQAIVKRGNNLSLETIAGLGDVVAANNLTDLASLSQARTNLGANNAGNLTAGMLPLARLSNINTQQLDPATIALFTNLPASSGTGGGNITNNGVALTNLQPVIAFGPTNIGSTNPAAFRILTGSAQEGHMAASTVGNILTDWADDQPSFFTKTGATTQETNKWVGTAVGFLGDKMALYYGCYDVGWTGRVFAAFGNTLTGFVHYGPVLSPGAAPAWDSGHISGGKLFQENGTNYLYYFGGTNGAASPLGTNSGTFEPAPEAIGVAYSTDGTNFTKYSGNPIITRGVSPDLDDNTIYQMCVIHEGNTYFGFYNGQDSIDNSERIFMVTAPSPLGPWTKYSGNPVWTGIPGVGARSIVSDPNVFRLRNGGWGIIAWNQEGALSNVQLISAYSWDLTNWFGARYLTNAGARITGYGPCVFDDNGPCLLTANDGQSQLNLYRPVPPKMEITGWRTNAFTGDNIFSGSNNFSGAANLSGAQYRVGVDNPSKARPNWFAPQTTHTKSADFSSGTLGSIGGWQTTFQWITNTASTNITYSIAQNFFLINSNAIESSIIIPANSTVWVEWRTDSQTNLAAYVKHQDATGGGSGTVTSVSTDTNMAVATPTTTPAITLTNTQGTGTLVKKTNSALSSVTLADSVTNTAVGATKIIGTDANSKEVGATLSGLTWDGTTLTASGSSSGSISNYGGIGTNTVLYSDNVQSIDVENNWLKEAGAGLTTFDWRNGVAFKPTTGAQVFDWENQIFDKDWTFNGNLTVVSNGAFGDLSGNRLVVTNPDNSIWIQSDAGSGTNVTLTGTVLSTNVPLGSDNTYLTLQSPRPLGLDGTFALRSTVGHNGTTVRSNIVYRLGYDSAAGVDGSSEWVFETHYSFDGALPQYETYLELFDTNGVGVRPLGVTMAKNSVGTAAAQFSVASLTLQTPAASPTTWGYIGANKIEWYPSTSNYTNFLKIDAGSTYYGIGHNGSGVSGLQFSGWTEVNMGAMGNSTAYFNNGGLTVGGNINVNAVSGLEGTVAAAGQLSSGLATTVGTDLNVSRDVYIGRKTYHSNDVYVVSGRLGIGTQSPAASFHVLSATSPYIRVESNTNNISSGFFVKNNTGKEFDYLIYDSSFTPVGAVNPGSALSYTTVTNGTYYINDGGSGTASYHAFLAGGLQTTNEMLRIPGAGPITAKPEIVSTNGFYTPQKTLTITSTGGSNIVSLSLSTNYSGTYFLTLTTNVYMMQPAGLVAGNSFYLSVVQDGTGTRTMSWDTNYWKFPSGVILTATTNANAKDVISCLVSPYGTNVYVVQTLNFQ